MILKTHGDRVALLGGQAVLSVEYSPADLGPGSAELHLENYETVSYLESTIRLDPWYPDAYEVVDWPACGVFILCGEPAIVTLRLADLAPVSSVALEYGEAETLDRPWFVEAADSRLLTVATERRVWCLDDRGAIRWMWVCRCAVEERWIIGAPVVARDRLKVPTRTMQGDSVVEISLRDGIEWRGP